MDGWVIVGTKLDSKQLENDLKNAERRLQQYEKEAEKLTKIKAKAEIDLQPYEEQKRIIQEMTDEALQYAQTEHEVKKQLEIEKAQLEELNQKYSKQISNHEEINNKIKENTKNQELMKNQIKGTGDKLKQARIKDNIEDIGKSTSNTIKKVTKWTLAIFGVRSAYNFVKQSASTLSQYNEKIGADLEYIRFAMASTLQPIIEGLIQLVYKLLTYVNYIAKAWFGVDLFANASAKAMNKGAKSAEKMKKSLAGFDEMNIMQDTSTSGAGGGATAPSIDLSQWQGEVPSWIKWIADNKDIVIAGLLGIAGGLTAVILGLTAMQGLGIGVAIAGIVLLIQDIIDMINDPSWENFIAILGDIAIVVGGLMLLFGNWWGLLIAGIGLIVKLVAENWDKIWAIIEPIASTIYNDVLVPIGAFVMATIDTIVSIIKLAISIIAGIFTTVVNIIANPFIVAKEIIIGVFNNIKSAVINIISGIKKLFSGDLKGALNDFKNAFSNIFGALWTIAKAPLNLIIGGINSLIKGINKISFDVPDWVPGIGGKKWGFNIPKIPKLAVGGIVNMPGRGVPVGGAITGEAGREGVIPLTDSQAMETLGQAIGKYININATVPVYVGNRQIAREIKKINADSDFAFNR